MKFFLPSLVLSAVCLALPTFADVTREPLATLQIQPGKTVERVEVKKLTITPGGKTNPHTHPGPVISYVVQGALIVKIAGGEEKTFKPGEVIYEPGNTMIEKFDNGSPTEPAVFIADYMLSADDKEIIHFLGPDKPAP
jgi:mannose-6-phosphate isomerase-like protein (cupin superfamily)